MNVISYTTSTAAQAKNGYVEYAVCSRSRVEKTILRQRRPITPRA